ncbi:MAG: hypothetical protein ABIR57_11050 [Aeromicrobium sp.]
MNWALVRKLLVALALLSLGSCSLGSCGSSTVAVPEGVAFRVEQARQDLQGRNIEMQVVNRSKSPISVLSARFTSGRFDGSAKFRGPATIPDGATTNLTFAMPKTRCGKGIDMTATVRYQVGAGKVRTSVVRPKDHYRSVGLAMSRDCAESTFKTLVIDRKFTTFGKGRDSVLEVGMTFTPKPGGGRVRLGPLDGTTLLKPAEGTGSGVDLVLAPGAKPYRVGLRIIPNRCDVHVVAEDRTGAIMPLHVESKASGKAFFYLRFTEQQRNQIFDFVAAHCGFGVTKDPLLAP